MNSSGLIQMRITIETLTNHLFVGGMGTDDVSMTRTKDVRQIRLFHSNNYDHETSRKV